MPVLKIVSVKTIRIAAPNVNEKNKNALIYESVDLVLFEENWNFNL